MLGMIISLRIYLHLPASYFLLPQPLEMDLKDPPSETSTEKTENENEKTSNEPQTRRGSYLSPPGLMHLFNSPKFSDFTIRVAGRTFHAHKAILSCYSAYFHNLFRGDWMETSSNTIDLNDDDPYAVEAMLQHLYDMEYSNMQHPGLSVELFDAKVYAIGEKYGIPSLKIDARRMFAAQLKYGWEGVDFPSSIAEVYASTPATDRGLRDIVTEVSCEHLKDLLEKEAFLQVLVDANGFVFDLLRYLNDKLESRRR
ncbi:BTB/POZ domain protein [Rasamsonia emersonii CBS 393.64]|uniref:BTB/POZ domain protein n=1 Tax=Rasamsonia emersonii (strain ATCC 16479 / CBS 393.64 / IMI 116815) TaxID=1408163 RepID=A0A0F4YMZ0_RASE3|nr:BTB/POZ domain protein [Rasamsonia emersonii CBS 393.64]KKA19475.1 BTB/POZ domain protein [Rasamsonia emersonii CBS 393.64]